MRAPTEPLARNVVLVWPSDKPSPKDDVRNPTGPHRHAQGKQKQKRRRGLWHLLRRFAAAVTAMGALALAVERIWHFLAPFFEGVSP